MFDLKTTEECYNKLAKELGLSLGKVIHPTRLALTGRTFSPGMFDVMVLLGREKTLELTLDGQKLAQKLASDPEFKSRRMENGSRLWCQVKEVPTP